MSGPRPIWASSTPVTARLWRNCSLGKLRVVCREELWPPQDGVLRNCGTDKDWSGQRDQRTPHSRPHNTAITSPPPRAPHFLNTVWTSLLCTIHRPRWTTGSAPLASPTKQPQGGTVHSLRLLELGLSSIQRKGDT